MPAFLVVVLPFISSLLVYTLGRGEEKKAYRISIGFSFTSLLLSLYLLYEYLSNGATTLYVSEFLSFRIDALSVVMAIAVSAISFIVHAYSVRYMQDDEGYARFFSLLDLTTFSIYITVLAGNLLILFTGWHLVGVFLYFLLSHNLRSEDSSRFALWTFLAHRAGDIPLLLAFVLLYKSTGTFDIGELSAKLMSPEPVPGIEFIGVLIVLSAFAKSAQFPLHVWLPYTMGGPTPVSALMHAGIVNAGGFLINRFAPVFYNAEVGLHLAFWVGLITAILGSTLMLMQNDIKRALGYSTVGQMGYMIMECGVGAFALAVYHLIAHGIFKATLFMGSGSVIHEARKDPNIPENEVYSFFVKRELPPTKVPWVVFALITVLVPLAIVILAHLVVGVEVFKYQGAIILLFFGWVTGAQTIFSIYKLGARSVYKLLMFVILSFSVVVLGYVVIGHSFEKFLYPDRELVDRIYENAGIHPEVFEAQILLLTLVVILGWLFVYYANQNRDVVTSRFRDMYITLYTHLSRELYIPDLYEAIGRKLSELSGWINRGMRWM
ncbi:NADH-quinone oxidoreductase subunit L [Hydrogenivirga sp. 128-5-R1-1]|uniref:NADH-quinone oxidoreductase subunit 5 family protein n=1 Tax=Hydrogenivirga sp. 128-5-R1-1 TaxID=392423 RepID=UPI00015EF9DA|nr:NADH-quinone oxidoreductase subunit L [Hydrogenivirga sp. 128-5-R1-1]EDP75302.1 NADH dehydrogenase [Hydrogenivirga sp. 128-5-R1-1]